MSVYKEWERIQIIVNWNVTKVNSFLLFLRIEQYNIQPIFEYFEDTRLFQKV